MLVLRLFPAFLSLLMLAAHFLRRGRFAVVALLAGVACATFVPRRWAARLVQGALVIGVLVWSSTLWQIASARLREGRPIARLVFILAGVGLLTGLSLLAFRSEHVRRHFHLGGREVVGDRGKEAR